MREAQLISKYDVSSFSLVIPQIHGGTNSVGQARGWRLWWSCERRLLPLMTRAAIARSYPGAGALFEQWGGPHFETLQTAS